MMRTSRSRFGVRTVVLVLGTMLTLPASSAGQQRAKLERVEQLPSGAQISVLGTFFSTDNKTEFTFEAPLARVWAAVKKVARDFDKDSRRTITAVDEQTNRVQNGKIDQMAMATAGAWGPFVDEFVTEATRVTDSQTKVVIIRTVMQREGRQWGPQKSNGKIEQYLLTKIFDTLKNPDVPIEAAVPAKAPNGPASSQLTNTHVIRMVTAKLPDDVIVATIKSSSSSTFDLAPDDLIKLKEAGVSDAVVRAMMDARSK